MRASLFVGRVGGLAVALGVGAASAVLGVPGVAWASPGQSASSERESSASDKASARSEGSRRAIRSGVARASAAAVDPDTAAAAIPAAVGDTAPRSRGSSSPLNERQPLTDVAVSGGDSQAAVDSPRPSAAVAVMVGEELAEHVEIPVPGGVTPAVVPVAEVGATVAAGNAVPVGAVAAAAPAPVMAAAEMAPLPAKGGVVESVLDLSSGPSPVAPLGTAVSWVMLAAARREIGGPAPAQAAPALSAEGPVVDPRATGVDTVTRPAVPAPSADADEAQVLVPMAAATAVDPIAAFFEQIASFVSQIVTSITQVITGVISAITNIFAPVRPNNAPTVSTPTVGTPDTATGVVKGTVSAVDADGDAVTYSASAATAKGAVVIDALTGEFTYTPTAFARFEAADLNASDAYRTDTFPVTATDGRGGVVQITVSVPVSPASPSLIALPGQMVATAVAGADGYVYQTSWNRNETFVTRIQADGDIVTFTQDGQSDRGGIVGVDGTTYQVSSSADTTTVRAFRPDGSVQDYVQPGVTEGNLRTFAGPNGTLYQSIKTGSADSGYTTTVLAISSDGSVTTYSQPGANDALGLLLNDGSVYQSSKEGTTTHISVFRPDGGVFTYALTTAEFGQNWTDSYFYPSATASDATYLQMTVIEEEPPGVNVLHTGLVRLNIDGTVSVVIAPQRGDSLGALAVGDDGTVYRTLGYFDTAASDWRSLTYALIARPDGTTIRTADWDGSPAGPAVVAPNGYAYQVSDNSSTTTVTAIGPDGSTTAYTQPGNSSNYPFINPDGSVGQFSYQPGSSGDSTSVLIIQPDGSSSTFTQAGQPGESRVLLSDQGMYVATYDYYTDTTLLRRYSADGSNSGITLPGRTWGLPTVGPDGSVYSTTYRWRGGGADRYYLTITRPDGSTKSYQLEGFATGGVVFGAEGIVYQPTSRGLWIVDKPTNSATDMG